MGAVTAQILRKVVEVSHAPIGAGALLASAGLPLEMQDAAAARLLVPADTYYTVLEQCAGADDPGLPFRYGAAVRPEDFGALGLALKTAHSVGEALERLVRYILVVTDTLQYQLTAERGGRRFLLQGRPFEQRRGVQLANECALAAVTSLLRQVAVAPVAPASVLLRHACPVVTPHEAYFGCPVSPGAGVDALVFSDDVLSTRTRLGDDGLSAFLLAQLDALHTERSARLRQSLVSRVRSAVTDLLSGGVPRRAEIARQLGMSERTLQRHLAEQGQSYQALVNDVRREVAESLLSATESSLSEVAFLTGFSEQSAFQRAFKSWTGKTPLGFRQAAV
jgi:AraC-like DNA-binding protein